MFFFMAVFFFIFCDIFHVFNNWISVLIKNLLRCQQSMVKRFCNTVKTIFVLYLHILLNWKPNAKIFCVHCNSVIIFCKSNTVTSTMVPKDLILWCKLFLASSDNSLLFDRRLTSVMTKFISYVSSDSFDHHSAEWNNYVLFVFDALLRVA